MKYKIMAATLLTAVLLLTGCDMTGITIQDETETKGVVDTAESTDAEETTEVTEATEATETTEATEATEATEMTEATETTTEPETIEPDIVKVTLQNYQSEIYESKKLVIVDFYADWCGPCQIIAPILDEIASENSSIKICKINVDEEQILASVFDIEYLPTLLIVKDGQIAQELVGVKTKDELMLIISSIS